MMRMMNKAFLAIENLQARVEYLEERIDPEFMDPEIDTSCRDDIPF